MAQHPFHDVAVVGIHNTRQARVLEGHDDRTITMEAALGAIADAGLEPRDIDGVIGPYGSDFLYQARVGPAWRSMSPLGIPALLDGVMAIASGMATTVLFATGGAGSYTQRASTAPWTRPTNEFVACYGMYTAADVLASRMVADPFHLLECAMTSEGGAAVVLTRADRADDLPQRPVYVLGGGTDYYGPAYQHPPVWDLGGHQRPDLVAGNVGRRAAEEAFAAAGLGPGDVDVCEFYDPFSFEIIRQFEAYGFCGPGEGGDYVTSGAIEPGGATPVTTDGGTMSFSHGGAAVQLLQRVMRGVEQLRGDCASMQVEGAEVALCTGGGAGALFTDVVLLGKERP